MKQQYVDLSTISNVLAPDLHQFKCPGVAASGGDGGEKERTKKERKQIFQRGKDRVVQYIGTY